MEEGSGAREVSTRIECALDKRTDNQQPTTNNQQPTTTTTKEMSATRNSASVSRAAAASSHRVSLHPESSSPPSHRKRTKQHRDSDTDRRRSRSRHEPTQTQTQTQTETETETEREQRELKVYTSFSGPRRRLAADYRPKSAHLNEGPRVTVNWLKQRESYIAQHQTGATCSWQLGLLVSRWLSLSLSLDTLNTLLILALLISLDLS